MYVGRTGRIGGDSPIVELLGATNILHKINFENFHGTDIGWYFFLPNFQYFFLSNSSIFSSLVQASVRAHFFYYYLNTNGFFEQLQVTSLIHSCVHTHETVSIYGHDVVRRDHRQVLFRRTHVLFKSAFRGETSIHIGAVIIAEPPTCPFIRPVGPSLRADLPPSATNNTRIKINYNKIYY